MEGKNNCIPESTAASIASASQTSVLVQETPLMFSRCSSLDSLNSCDSHSMHSSAISEYSRCTSEMISLSELYLSHLDLHHIGLFACL